MSQPHPSNARDLATKDDTSSTDIEMGSIMKPNDLESNTAPLEAQAGVKNVEALSMTWTKWGLIAAYSGILLMAFTTSLESQVVQSLGIFATSSFSQHSMIATVYVIQNVANAVIKPPMAKVADAFGRFEAFCFSIFLYILGYALMASSKSVSTFATAQIFYSSGNTGLQILQQIFIADTSDLSNRALWSTFPCLPFLINVWIGASVGSAILKSANWRWGYGMWCIILPAVFTPLAITMLWNNRKAKKEGLIVPSPLKGVNLVQGAKNLWFELDLGGIILLSAAFALILLPLTIASKVQNGWANPSIITMIALGAACLISFPIWECSKKMAPRALLPMHLLKSRTFCAGCGIGFFYFLAFYMSVFPYFYSYLLVVQHQSVTSAGRIVQTFSFTSTIAALCVGLAIKYSKWYKPFVCLGACIFIAGLGLMYLFRSASASIPQIISALIVVGTGGGLLNVATQTGIQAGTDHQNVAVATAIYMTFVELGGAVGAAVSGAIWSRVIPANLALHLPDELKVNATVIFNDINKAISYAPESIERLAIDRAYQETMSLLLKSALFIAIPLVPLSLVMKWYNMAKMDQNVKGRVIGRNAEVDKQEEREKESLPASGGS